MRVTVLLEFVIGLRLALDVTGEMLAGEVSMRVRGLGLGSG
jgi:hypothetical protein